MEGWCKHTFISCSTDSLAYLKVLRWQLRLAGLGVHCCRLGAHVGLLGSPWGSKSQQWGGGKQLAVGEEEQLECLQPSQLHAEEVCHRNLSFSFAETQENIAVFP